MPNDEIQHEQTGETQDAEASQDAETSLDEDFAAIEGASDEELEALLNGYPIEDEGDDEQVEDESAEEAGAGKQEAATGEQDAAATEEPERKDGEAESAVSAEYVKKLEERLAQQEAFIKRRSTELGELRRQLRHRTEQLRSFTEDDLADPGELVDARLELRNAEEQLRAIDVEEAAIAAVYTNQQTVHANIPPQEWNVPNMVRCLEEDGLPAEKIRQFAENPYLVDAVTLIQLHKRQKAENAVRQLFAYAKKLIAENEQLKKKPQQVLKTVERNMKRPSAVSGANGGSGAVRGLGVDPSQVPFLSDEELEAILSRAA